ncbi:MAG: DUF2062 domain-containing protein [Halieaceae bacterium]|jgi:uncharacterized protein (DUF2062 family)|nr:DUF2062 domain-containing protein [Halieaceae bacterium]
MPRNTLKSFLPSPARIKRSGSLDVFGEWIYASNLWHLNRYSASMAFFVGLFLAFIPVPGQMLLAAAAAVMLRCNLPLSVALVWLTNPLTVPAIFYIAYQVGALLIDVPVRDVEFALTLEWLQTGLQRVWKPLVVGCLVCGLFFGSLGYFVVNVLWRIRVIRQWRRRKRSRAARRNDASAPARKSAP